MPDFSRKSHQRLSTAGLQLQQLFLRVIQRYDCTVIQGERGKEEQDTLFASGRSKVVWPNSKHNAKPSLAVDAAPYLPERQIPWPVPPEDWSDTRTRSAYIKDICQFYHFAGYVEGVASEMQIGIRWGGDWDRDHDLQDQTFDDLVHFELYDGGQ